MICGCDNNIPRDEYELQEIKNNVSYITVDDHEYLLFRLPQATTHGYIVNLISLCHSPKCKCLKKKDKKQLIKMKGRKK